MRLCTAPWRLAPQRAGLTGQDMLSDSRDTACRAVPRRCTPSTAPARRWARSRIAVLVDAYQNSVRRGVDLFHPAHKVFVLAVAFSRRFRAVVNSGHVSSHSVQLRQRIQAPCYGEVYLALFDARSGYRAAVYAAVPRVYHERHTVVGAAGAARGIKLPKLSRSRAPPQASAQARRRSG